MKDRAKKDKKTKDSGKKESNKKHKKDRSSDKKKKHGKDKKLTSRHRNTDEKYELHVGDSSSKDSILADLLNWGLVTYPQTLTDLISMVVSLDQGEYVRISDISSVFIREYYTSLMVNLPVKLHSTMGWYKETIDTSVSERINGYFERYHAIKQPTSRSISMIPINQSYLIRLLALLEQFPELKADMPMLCQNILDGNAVQLDDLENEDIYEGLERLFKVLGLEYSEAGYGLPEDNEPVCKSVAQSLRSIIAMFEFASKRQAALDGESCKAPSSSNSSNTKSQGGASTSSMKDTRQRSESSSSGSDYSVDSGSDTDSIHAAPVPRAPVVPVGPSMPTREQLQQAAALTQQKASRRVAAQGLLGRGDDDNNSDDVERCTDGHDTGVNAGYTRSGQRPSINDNDGADDEKYEEDEEDDDEYGPQVYNPLTADPATKAALARQQQQPLGFVGIEISSDFVEAFNAPAAKRINDSTTGTFPGAAAAEKSKDGKGLEREEWLLTPGDSKAISELGGAVQGNRKFQTGKQAKQRAEALAIQKEFIRQEQMKQQKRITSGDDSGEGAGAAGAAEGRDSAAPGNAGNTGVSQEVAMQQYELQRGPSLMDAHMQQRQGTEKLRAGQKRERQAFDREKEMSSHKKLNSQQVQQLVETARELGQRFDRGAVQRNF